MIQGKKDNTEQSYRAIALDSSSSLKDFSLDRKKYYKRYILGDRIEEKENHAINMGRIVETLLLEPELFDEKFYMSAIVTVPTGLKLKFAEALYDVTKEATNDEGVVTKSFGDLSKEAYEIAGFKISYERVLKEFIGSDNEIYFNEIRTVRSKNLTVITTQNVTTAEKIVETLRTNPVTAEIVNLVDSPKYSIYNQFKIEDFKIDGLPLKSMLDKVVVNHEDKTVQMYDLKCVWAVENFLEEYYLYRRAYIQGFVYNSGLKSLTCDADNKLYGYTVLSPKFMVCDSIDYYNPLIFEMDEQDMKNAYEGFQYKNRKYVGVKEIIEELIWATENNVWNISKTNYLNKGIVKLTQ